MPRFRISLCDCSSLLTRFINWFEQSSVLYALDYFVRRILGKVLVFFVYGLLSFITFVIVTIVLPFESLHKPQWLIYILCVTAVYFVFSIIYYYQKACKTPPGSPKKKHAMPFCYRCQNHKPYNAHHCGICGICVLDMGKSNCRKTFDYFMFSDHHCIWINQCVGANNHRYFLQFIGFLAGGCLVFTLVAWPTFYKNYWGYTPNESFCGLQELSTLPWRNNFCKYGTEFVSTSIFFSYALAIVVFFLVGGLFWWNFSLISSGQTYIDFLQNGGERGCLRQVTWPFDSENFSNNWKRFLGLRNGRTFLCNILLPSTHLPTTDDDMEDLTELVVV
ncbi:Palmitoyltransferase [Aphelenchoides bicaudatus]|nr:Palmitoyltransferase [Aphelenchoides bicaudatus]